MFCNIITIYSALLYTTRIVRHRTNVVHVYQKKALLTRNHARAYGVYLSTKVGYIL